MLASENPIKHLANPSHIEQVRDFLAANLLDHSRLKDFIISEKDFSKVSLISRPLCPFTMQRKQNYDCPSQTVAIQLTSPSDCTRLTDLPKRLESCLASENP